MCAVCGHLALSVQDIDEPVVHQGKNHGWSRTIRVWDHGNGVTHSVGQKVQIPKGK